MHTLNMVLKRVAFLLSVFFIGTCLGIGVAAAMPTFNPILAIVLGIAVTWVALRVIVKELAV